MSGLEVALACGFVSASHSSKSYREVFHKTPREERLSPRGTQAVVSPTLTKFGARRR